MHIHHRAAALLKAGLAGLTLAAAAVSCGGGGGNDEEMIEDAYSRCIDSLEFRIKPMPAEK